MQAAPKMRMPGAAKNQVLSSFVYLSGRVAEWPIASVLKTEVPQGTVGSNPTSSVELRNKSSSEAFVGFEVKQTKGREPGP